MLPLLFGAKDRARNRKRDNYAGDNSRVHLQILRENSIRRGYEAQNCHAIFPKQNPIDSQPSELLRQDRN
jgi:hypothetical protein